MLSLIAGIVALIDSNIYGLIFIVLSLPCLLIRYGLVIDAEERQLKFYTGFAGYKKGDWIDISTAQSLYVKKIKQSQRVWAGRVANKTIVSEVYELYLDAPDYTLNLMTDDKKKIFKRAQAIASSLDVKFFDEDGSVIN